MIESNFATLKYYRLSRTETNKRLAYLENTLKSLESYHLKAKPAKRPIIAGLILRYDELIDTLKTRIGE